MEDLTDMASMKISIDTAEVEDCKKMLEELNDCLEKANLLLDKLASKKELVITASLQQSN